MFEPIYPTERYTDLGGLDNILQEITETIEWPLLHPEIFEHLGVEPPRGVLLFGPPGCGKTHLAFAIAGELNIPFFNVSAPELISSLSGGSELKIRNLFDSAINNAPSIIFIDEIDSITPKREIASKEMEKRIVSQLLTCMDSLSIKKNGGKSVIVIGATNRPDSLDNALRRAGRFDREICLSVPDEDSRINILKTLVKDLKLSGDFNFEIIARNTPGYVGADLRAITKEAATVAINRIFSNLRNSEDKILYNKCSMRSKHREKINPFSDEDLEKFSITMDDFNEALKKVQPSSKREGFATIPNVTWDDIGGLEEIRKEMELAIIEPIRSREKYKILNIKLSCGILLYGPPGCGKTLLAKAIANQTQANFISIKGPELLNKFVGESEKAIRMIFERAKSSSPCIIFFDEIDSLVPRRTDSDSNGVTSRIVNQMLTELDGLEERKDIFIIAATNRPDIIDRAMMRPGRIDKLLYVPLPTVEERLHILRACIKNTPLVNIDIEKIAQDHRCEGFSGADISLLVREASELALIRHLKNNEEILALNQDDFENALKKISPSVSKEDRKKYEKIKNSLFS